MSECIEYNGEDRPQVKIKGRRFSAYRLVAMLFHGLEIQDTRTLVCHKCDNPKCINPEHLFLGTQKENLADMYAKGRQVSPSHSGEKNGRAKLTAGQVADIRTFYKEGNYTYQELADDYGVSPSTISGICRGHSWKTT